MRKLTIEELANEINNSILTKSVYLDKRINPELSVRRIRDFLSKNILQEGIREGRKKFFNDSHINRLKEIRNLQEQGFSDKQLIDYFSIKQESKKESSLNQLLNSISDRENSTYTNSISKKTRLSVSACSLGDNLLNQKKISDYESSSWEEFKLGKTENIILKIENNTQIRKEDIEDINNILKQIQEQNND